MSAMQGATRQLWTWWGVLVLLAGVGGPLTGAEGAGSRHTLTIAAGAIAALVGVGFVMWSRSALDSRLGLRLLGLTGLGIAAILFADLPNTDGTGARVLTGFFAVALVIPALMMLLSRNVSEPAAPRPRPAAGWLRWFYLGMSVLSLFIFAARLIDGEGPMSLVLLIASWGFLDMFQETDPAHRIDAAVQ
ncbi:MAG: hypothetical protein GX344_13025 [Intrasporangiaceae bacterium]|nr:hypothetical protein [Intrasporangiaceae bacterium]